ncbi:MAG: putative lipid II flippase FtsW [Miniphocaeibacter sp.]|uniref:putative lipid II flippase FtsW n=1 Tax=Miniphocaeibacter sp. TaxID=3100973 RepID=UPI00183B0A1E|nr:putative lipid II flippase FtsW [Gallicola sp.]
MKNKQGSIDYKILITTIILIIIGTIMVFSASWPYATRLKNDPYHFLKKQIVFLIIGFVAMYITSKINYKIYNKYAVILYILTICLSIIVLFVGDVETYSAKRWITIKSITIMPSDFLKLGTIFAISRYISNNYKKINTIAYGFIPMVIFAAISGFLVFKQPDLSTTLVILGLILSMFIIAGIEMKYLTVAILGVGAVGLVGILASKSIYSRSSRIEAWLDPLKDLSNTGWQLAQSLFAISYGGFFGVGIGKSRHKFSYLSEAHNDFIFAIICEELGFIGAMVIILLYIYLIYLGMKLAFSLKDVFAKFLVIGIMLLLGIQSFTNIAVALGLIPPTGLTLPFISYGGSSLIVYMTMIGIVLNVSRTANRR